MVFERESIQEIYYVRIPSASLVHISSAIYDLKLEEAINAGFQTEEKLVEFLKKQGIFTENDEKRIDECVKSLDGLNLMLSKVTNSDVASKYSDIYTGKIDTIEKELSALRSKRNSLLYNSAEHHANSAKMQFLLPFCSFTVDGKLVWDTYNAFELEGESDVVTYLLSGFIGFYNECFNYNTRKLARNNEWRSKWRIACKTGSPLLPGPVSEWTPIQTALCFWSNFYDGVYEAYESPPDWIIEDDEELDKWIKAQHEKHDQDKIQKFGRGVSKDHDDVMIFQNRENYFKEYVDKQHIREFNETNKDLGINISQDIMTGEIKEYG